MSIQTITIQTGDSACDRYARVECEARYVGTDTGNPATGSRSHERYEVIPTDLPGIVLPATWDLDARHDSNRQRVSTWLRLHGLGRRSPTEAANVEDGE